MVASSSFRIRLLPRLATLVLCAMSGLTAPASAQDVAFSAPGLDERIVDRLQSNSLLLRTPEDGTPRTPQDTVAAAQADFGRLIAILYEEGYFAPTIDIRVNGRDAGTITPFSPPTRIDSATVTVAAGQPFALREARIAPLASGTDLPEGFRPGAPATTPVLRDAARAGIDGWRARGHATAAIAGQRLVADNRAAFLDADLRIDPGPVVTFGALLPEGADRMRIERIVEIAGLPTGEVFSPEALARAEDRLRDTGVFSAVALQETAPGADDVMDIRATVAETALRRFGFGGEISSDEGAQILTYWIHRNLFGGGERLRLYGTLAGIGQSGVTGGADLLVGARLSRPATFTPDTLAYVDLDALRFQEPSFDLTSLGVELGVEHWASENLSLAAAGNLRISRIDDGLGTRTITVLSMPLGAIYENRDEPLDPRAGAYAELDVTPFFPVGGRPGAAFRLDGRGYVSFGDAARTRLAGRVQLGSVVGADLSDIPPDFLFYSGGSGTVRGQDYQSLGVVRGGVAGGGRSFVGLSGELRQDIGDTNLGLVGFADAGLVGEDALGGGPSDWHAGVGLGIRYTTPFGPIRVDLATPASGDDAGQELFLYIGIGQAF